MKRILLIVLTLIAYEIAAMDAAHNAAEQLPAPELPHGINEDFSADDIARLTMHCQEGNLTIDLLDEFTTHDYSINARRLSSFLEDNKGKLANPVVSRKHPNRAALRVIGAGAGEEQIPLGSLGAIENGYVLLMFLYKVDTEESSRQEKLQAVLSFLKQHQNNIKTIFAQSRESNEDFDVRRADKCARMLNMLAPMDDDLARFLNTAPAKEQTRIIWPDNPSIRSPGSFPVRWVSLGIVGALLTSIGIKLYLRNREEK